MIAFGIGSVQAFRGGNWIVKPRRRLLGEHEMHSPRWKILAESIGPHVFETLARVLDPAGCNAPDLLIAPQLAVFHLNAALNTSIEATRIAQPSVAVCLLRQCVEALTLVDVGLQVPPLKNRLLACWNEGTKTVGGLRAELAEGPWKTYGPGLWGECWEDFFGNLAGAVQPYAHYTPELKGWQIGVVSFDGTNRFVFRTAASNPDPLKATRLSLMQAIVVWTSASLLLHNRQGAIDVPTREQTNDLRQAIAGSDLLFKSKNWADELVPHVAFKPGAKWAP